MTTKKIRVAVLDDDPDILKFLNKTLNDDFIEVFTYSSIKNFLLEFKRKKLDLCLIDLRIGDDKSVGFEVMKAIRKKIGYEIPLFMLSGNGTKEAIDEAFNIGASDYIVKPIDLTILKAKIHSLPLFKSLDGAFDNVLPIFQVPDSKREGSISLKINLKRVDESGITFTSKHYISKRTRISVKHSKLDEILGSRETHVFFITSTKTNTDGSFNFHSEFDYTNKELRDRVCSWLAQKLVSLPA
jgi:DNA-binding response OmpR family regulator